MSFKRLVGELWTVDLGSVGYREALALQAAVAARRQVDEIPDTLLLLEHPPVYTRGRRTLDGELSFGEDFYKAQGIDVVDADRGGRATYHGPGQLVGYPIMRVSDIGRHLRMMESAIVAALAEEEIEARSRCAEGPDYTGVWVAERKIASIGVHVSRGVSTHGFAINVTNDLTPFDWIVPCGLSDVRMTSVEQELDRSCPIDEQRFRERVVRCFAKAHECAAVAMSAQHLGLPANDHGATTMVAA